MLKGVVEEAGDFFGGEDGWDGETDGGLAEFAHGVGRDEAFIGEP